MPFPHTPNANPDIVKYDQLSMADRIEQIKDDLTPSERAALEGFVLLCSGGTAENTGFYDIVRWWALSFYTYQGIIDTCVTFKFRGGQSSFARRFFEEALSTGKLSYAFRRPIASVKDSGKVVQVTTEDGQRFSASRLICTIPLNVLSTIKFEPPLPKAKQEAIEIGQINQCSKVHVEVRDRALRSWSAIAPSNKLVYAFGDGTTPAGNTHIVAFGADVNPLHPEEDIGATKEAFTELTPMDIQRKRPIRKGSLVHVPTRVWDYIPGRPSYSTRKRLVCKLRLGNGMERLYRRSHRGRLQGCSCSPGRVETVQTRCPQAMMFIYLFGLEYVYFQYIA
jgi:hypothetical protein